MTRCRFTQTKLDTIVTPAVATELGKRRATRRHVMSHNTTILRDIFLVVSAHRRLSAGSDTCQTPTEFCKMFC